MAELPEVPEAQADPELRRLYDEIKAVAGTAMVNLVYRHLATIPNALPWAWTALKTSISYEEIRLAAAHLQVQSFGRPLPRELYSLLGIQDEDLATIGRILAAYNQANALNIVSLAALRHLARQLPDGPGIGFEPSAPALPTERPSSNPPLPRILPMAEMDAATALLVRRLSHLGNISAADDAVTPSLYRHLAHWPSYVAFVLGALDPLSTIGALQTARQDTVASAQMAAQPLIQKALRQGIPPLPANSRAGLSAALDLFVDRVIAKMLPIGHTLLALSPAEERI